MRPVETIGASAALRNDPAAGRKASSRSIPGNQPTITQPGTASTASVSGSSLLVSSVTSEERALKGFDVEVGWRAPLFSVDEPRQLRLYAGGYRFKDDVTDVSGPRVRAELTMAQTPWLWQGAQLMASVEVQEIAAGEVLYRDTVPNGKGGLEFSPDGRALAALGCCEPDSTIKVWEDLRGKSVSVNKGTPYENLSKAKGVEHGFTVQVYDTQPDATQAVLSGRAYATLGGNTTIRYAASKNPQFVADLELLDTRAPWAAPVPKNNPKLRAQLQDAIDCMKQDGTLAKMSEKWFGRKPPPDGLEVVITPGYGPPGMPGYDPTPHDLKCG